MPALPEPPVLEGLLDLARLPWFGVRDGRLVRTDATVGPILDIHTHLALAYLRPMALDLHRATPRTEHYLPAGGRIDLDVYQNRNFTPARLAVMKRDLTLGALRASGPRATHTVPNLVREMDDLGVARSVLLPIDLPLLSDNAGHALDAARREPRLLAFGSVHPLSPRLAARLDAQVRRGARGIKVHPAAQMIRPDHPRAMRLYGLCGERGLPVLWHCGPVGIEPAAGRRRSQVALYEPPIAAHPGTTFVLGHAGALQMEQALVLARRYPNAWLDLSCQSLPAVRAILDEADPDRIVHGSDWPFYPQAIGIAKVLLATEGRPALRAKVLWQNAARLLGLDP